MIRRTLIPLDGSELAEQVIPHLLRFIAPERTELLVMTALPSPHLHLLDQTLRSFAPEQIAIMKAGETTERVQAVAQQLNEMGFRVASQFLSGAPAENILRLAEEGYADLIAMSTHGRRGIELALLGSVADEVVRKARPPVFLVPAQAVVKLDPLPRNILLPLDGSPLAETAIPVACHFAQVTGAVIHLIRVVEPHDDVKELTAKQISSESDYEEEHPIIRQASCYLQRIQLRLQLAGTVSHYHIMQGEPADTIARVAHAENADLIVMSTHGRAGMERMVHGSVAGQVLSNTTCPVLLMRGKVPVEAYESEGNAVSAASFC